MARSAESRGPRSCAARSAASAAPAERSQVKRRARSSAAAPIALAQRLVVRPARRTASASSPASSASRPVRPWSIASGRPPTASAALGVRHAPASITVRPQPSAEDAVTFTHARCKQLVLALLVHEAVHAHPVAQAAALDLALQRLAVVALAGHVEHRAGHLLEHVEQQLDPLVALQPAEVEQRGLRRPLARAVGARVRAHVHDADVPRATPISASSSAPASDSVTNGRPR